MKYFDSMRVFSLEVEFWALIAMKWSDMVTVNPASMCSQMYWNELSQTDHLWLPLKYGEALSPQPGKVVQTEQFIKTPTSFLLK